MNVRSLRISDHLVEYELMGSPPQQGGRGTGGHVARPRSHSSDTRMPVLPLRLYTRSHPTQENLYALEK